MSIRIHHFTIKLRVRVCVCLPACVRVNTASRALQFTDGVRARTKTPKVPRERGTFMWCYDDVIEQITHLLFSRRQQLKKFRK